MVAHRLHDRHLGVIALKNPPKHRRCLTCDRDVELVKGKEGPKGFAARLRAALRDKWKKMVKWLLAS